MSTQPQDSAARQEMFQKLLTRSGLRGDRASAAIPRSSAPAPWPLSHAQERLWFLYQLEPDDASYNIVGAMQIDGELDEAILEKSLREMVRRHESLRTRFIAGAGTASQDLLPVESFELGRIDLTARTVEEQEREVAEMIRSETGKPFDLVVGPVFRASLVRRTARSCVLLLAVHHIVADGWSLSIFLRELGVLYDSLRAGRHPTLAALPIRYADYAIWQRQRAQGEALQKQLEYWKENLSGAPPMLTLVTDRARPAHPSRHGALQKLTVPDEVTRNLKKLAAEQRATLFMVTLAAFQVLLWRFSGQTDVVVGTPVAGRSQREAEALIGLFVNTLALRTRVRPEASFREHLDAVRQTALGAYANQDVPFASVVRHLQPQRDRSRPPIFQVMFGLQSDVPPVPDFGGLEVRSLPAPNVIAKFDITLTLVESAQGLWGELEYATELFDAGTIRSFTDSFQSLLAGVARDPELSLARLPLLSDPAREWQVRQWNGPVATYPRDACLHDLIAEQASRTPNAAAVECGVRRLTYAELDARANQVAQRLVTLGAGADHIVGLCVERSIEMLVGILGVLKAGAAFLPLDPQYPADRLAFMLADANVRIVLTQSALAPKLPSSGAVVLTFEELLQEQERQRAAPLVSVTPHHLAYVIYTSGSTGKPKGVMIHHKGAVNLYRWYARKYGIGPNTRILVVSSFAFDLTLKNLLGPLLTGGTVVLAPSRLPSGGELLSLLRDEGIHLVNCSPTQLGPLLTTMAGMPAHDRPHFDRLSYVLLGGEPIATQNLDLLQAACSDLVLINSYGPTEITDVCADSPFEVDVPIVSTIGRPVANTQAYVLDARLQPVPAGMDGELYIGGDGVGRGYVRRPALTAERFIPDPFGSKPGARLYRTGDRVRRRSDGALEFRGRVDQQIKVRGVRIEPGEIEACLKNHPHVDQVAVGVDGAGGSDVRLIAWAVLVPGAATSRGELRRFLIQQLPAHMVPTDVVLLSEMPLTASGKLDRNSLRVPETHERLLDSELVPPRDATESALASVWQQILRLERVGVHDNFFALGGDSMRALQLAEHAEAKSRGLTVGMLFEHQTIAALARGLGDARDASPAERQPPLHLLTLPSDELVNAPEDIVTTYPLSGMQAVMVEKHAADTRRTGVYHVQQSFRLRDSKASASAMRQALQAMVDTHPTLRTVFVRTRDGSVVQGVRRATRVELLEHDITGRGDEEQRRYIHAEMLADRKRRFVVGLLEPLFRFQWFQIAGDEFELLLSMHHAIDDGWGKVQFLAQLADIYEQCVAGRQPTIAERANVFREYVAWERATRSSPDTIDFWRSRQIRLACKERLPRADQSVASSDYSHRFTVAAVTHRALVARSRRLGVTLKSLLLHAHLRLIGELGNGVPTVGVLTNGRSSRLSDPLRALGLFWNLLPFSIEHSEDEDADVRRVHQALLDLEAHSLYPLQQIAADRNVDELFFATFNYVDFHHAEGADAIGGVQVCGVRDLDRFHYPLNHRFALDRQAGEVLVHAEYDPEFFTAEAVSALNSRLSQLVIETGT